MGQTGVGTHQALWSAEPAARRRRGAGYTGKSAAKHSAISQPGFGRPAKHAHG